VGGLGWGLMRPPSSYTDSVIDCWSENVPFTAIPARICVRLFCRLISSVTEKAFVPEPACAIALRVAELTDNPMTKVRMPLLRRVAAAVVATTPPQVSIPSVTRMTTLGWVTPGGRPGWTGKIVARLVFTWSSELPSGVYWAALMPSAVSGLRPAVAAGFVLAIAVAVVATLDSGATGTPQGEPTGVPGQDPSTG